MEEEGAEERDSQATKELFKLMEPNYWNLNKSNNQEYEIERNFEDFMISVSEHTKEDLNTITTFRFYSLIEHIKARPKNG